MDMSSSSAYMEGSELPVRSNPDLVLLQGVADSLG